MTIIWSKCQINNLIMLTVFRVSIVLYFIKTSKLPKLPYLTSQYQLWAVFFFTVSSSPWQARKHCFTNIVSCPCFPVWAVFLSYLEFCTCLFGKSMFLMLETCEQTRKHYFCNKNVSKFVWKHFCLLGSKILFSQQCFPRCFQVCPGL